MVFWSKDGVDCVTRHIESFSAVYKTISDQSQSENIYLLNTKLKTDRVINILRDIA